MAEAYRVAVLADDPLAYWPLEEMISPMVVDLTGHGYDGTYMAGVLLGRSGAFSDGSSLAPRFDGTSWVEMGDVLGFAGTASFSVECWASLEVIDTNTMTLVSKIGSIDGTLHGLRLNVLGTQVAIRRAPNGWSGVPDAVVTDEFFHVVGTYDGVSLVLFVNGTKVSASVDSQDMPDHSGSFEIGAAGLGARFRGIIDEVAVFDYALSDTQVAAHYAAGQAL